MRSTLALALTTPAAALLLATGCGYVGDTLPPLLRIPQRVDDLAAEQRGSVILVQFTVPALTTEGALLREPPTLDLRAGPGPAPWDQEAWAAQAQRLGPGPVEGGRARYQLPAAQWAGQEIVFGVRVIGANGRDAGWSNFATVAVVPPLDAPRELRAESVPAGLRLVWNAKAPLFRIFRRGPDEKVFAPAAEVAETSWVDTAAAPGSTYEYRIVAVQKTSTGEARSEPSEVLRAVPVDRSPPAAPAGLRAVASTATIELAWERNPEPDLVGYRVYRAASEGEFQPLAETGQNPSYSDQDVQSGKPYRYAVQAIDAGGNESPLSPPVAITAP